tara:strand:+ start:209 stop:475 length:267 start_codon:yes stop_codon:yes gene_type:complete
MKKIIIYSSSICPYCLAAKRLLENLGLNFNEKIIDNAPDLKNEMISISNGKKTVPQIFIGQKHVGGYDDLEILHNSGKLMSFINEKKT